MPLQTGETLHNRYRIVKLLGQGGFGAVYRAWDLNLNGPIALKENFDSSPAAQKQFALEASILFNLRHPNLPRIMDHFSLPTGQYLVMDYIEGQDLQEKLEQAGGPLPEAQVLPWIEQICDALTYLHSQSPPIIHRDIKPSNIKITTDGRAILVDFGLVKAFDPSLKTTMGARAVTPGYSPPEQYGHGTTDIRSDIYALGATLYTALTGEEPPESVHRTVGIPLTSPRSLIPSIPAPLETAIQKAMTIQPRDRFQSAEEFRQALRGTPQIQPPRISVPKKVKHRSLFLHQYLLPLHNPDILPNSFSLLALVLP